MTKRIAPRCPLATLFCCAMVLVVTVGCQDKRFSLAPVSGTVTVNGEAVPDLRIVFHPTPTEDVPTPGPFSSGKTDREGKFRLVARGGKFGAVVGFHRVGFELPGDVDEDALEDAQAQLEETMAEQGVDPESVEAARNKINKIKKRMKGFAIVPSKYLEFPIIEVEVPSEGLVDYSIELTECPRP